MSSSNAEETHLQIAQRVWPEAIWRSDEDGNVWGFLPKLDMQMKTDWMLECRRGNVYQVGRWGRSMPTVELAFESAKKVYTAFAIRTAQAAGLQLVPGTYDTCQEY